MKKLLRLLAEISGTRRRRIRRLQRLRGRLRIAEQVAELRSREAEILREQVAAFRDLVSACEWSAKLQAIQDRAAAEMVAKAIAGKP